MRSWRIYVLFLTYVGIYVCNMLYLVLRKRLNRDMMDAATKVSGSAETVVPKGFLNSSIFVKWLEHDFEDSVPLSQG